jgi:hypothetical protein
LIRRWDRFGAWEMRFARRQFDPDPIEMLCGGADERVRTSDPRITNALLYHLSYIGMVTSTVWFVLVTVPGSKPGVWWSARQLKAEPNPELLDEPLKSEVYAP